MPLGDFVESGSSPKPLPIERSLRFLFGLGTGYFFVWNFLFLDDRVGTEAVHVGYLVGAGFAWWYLSDLFVVGFGLRWGRWPQIGSVPIAAVLVIAGLVAGEGFWSPQVTWGIFILTQFWFGFSSVLFILAAIFAVPG